MVVKFVLILITVIAVILSCLSTSKMMKVIKESITEKSCEGNFEIWKIFNMILKIGIFVDILLFQKQITSRKFFIFYYIIVGLVFIIIKINKKYLNHVINLMFRPELIGKKESEYIFGKISYVRGQYVCKYRIIPTIVKI